MSDKAGQKILPVAQKRIQRGPGAGDSDRAPGQAHAEDLDAKETNLAQFDSRHPLFAVHKQPESPWLQMF